MSEATALRADLARELAARGQAVSVTRTEPGTYDPTTGSAAAETPVVHTGLGRVGNYSDRLIDGTNIRRGDRLVTWQPDLESETFVPRESDIVSYGDTSAVVVSVKVREVGGEWFAYTLQIRR